MTLTIKTATASDAKALSMFGARTFYQTYIAGHAQAVVNAHIAHAFSPAHQARELADPTITTILGVDDSGTLVAFAQWRFAPAPSSGTHPYVMVDEVQDDIVLVHTARWSRVERLGNRAG